MLTLFNSQELHCLVKNIYFESRGESTRGQEAVALVTLNRVKSKDFPDTVCKTVYQKHQFSWTSVKARRVTDKVAWAKAETVAYRVLMGNHSLGRFPALFFHARSVKPDWGRVKLASIGRHVFYA